MKRILRNKITDSRRQLASDMGARVRALTGVVVAFGMGAAAFRDLTRIGTRFSGSRQL